MPKALRQFGFDGDLPTDGNNVMMATPKNNDTLRVTIRKWWLQRRNDLIPNLVSTVKGYSKYESETLAKVTGLRSAIMNAGSHQEAMDKSNQLTATLKSLFAVNENYPELKANTEYQQLMEELANTENKIAYSRQLYNSVTASMNAKRQSFPSNVVAKAHHFDAIEYLKAPEAARTAPKVEF